MPAFSDRLYSDKDLHADFDRLRLGLSAADAQLLADDQEGPLSAIEGIEQDKHQDELSKGMRAWRARGTAGACSGCHAPDGFDLAQIGYPNHTILRRAIQQGRSAAEAVDIVRMIDAQRRWHRIEAPCSPSLFRPLQPTGRPAIEPPYHADEALVRRLAQQGVNLDAEVTSLRDARAYLKAIGALDPSKIALAIPLSRWSSDAAHGDAFRTTSEWIPEIALEPATAQAQELWTERTNRYLEEPTTENFWRLYGSTDSLSTSRFVSAGFASRLSREKFRSVLVFQHIMRTGSAPALPESDLQRRFPVWETARVASVLASGCAETSEDGPLLPCWKYPDRFYEKMGRNRTALIADVRSLTAPWFVSGLLYEPALIVTEGGRARMGVVHQALLHTQAEPLPMHHLYLGLLRLVRANAQLGLWATASPVLEGWAVATLDAVARASAHSPAARKRADVANRAVLMMVEQAMRSPTPHPTPEVPARFDLRILVEAMARFSFGSDQTVQVAKRILRRLSSVNPP